MICGPPASIAVFARPNVAYGAVMLPSPVTSFPSGATKIPAGTPGGTTGTETDAAVVGGVAGVVTEVAGKVGELFAVDAVLVVVAPLTRGAATAARERGRRIPPTCAPSGFLPRPR